MANRKHLLHVKSNVAEKTKQYGIDDFLVTPKKPVDSTTGKATDDTLMYGEIAVNYGKSVEALTIRNTEDDIVAFVNENDFNEAGEITAAGLATEKTEREAADAIEKFERETADATEKAERQEADATEKTAREEAFNQLNDKIDNLEVGGMVSTTYAEIKGLREQSKLKPGQFYRITDYVTTTVQENTQSANHAFDVIVIATDVDTINENAKAIQREGDTYFADSNLDAWEIKYDLDNDTNKYAWADATNGKGVIFYMKDEWNNECPYDFKNIQFKVGAKQQAGTIADVFYFTFSVATGVNDATVTDHSLNGAYCYGNKMGLYMTDKCQLNVNVFRNTSATSNCNSNTFGNGCNSNTFGNGCGGNTFGNNCYSNAFTSGCSSNTFGNNCHSNTLGGGCNSNSFGNSCDGNTFGNGCYNNLFGNGCESNTFGDGCENNSFGNSCDGNTFATSCDSNTFGNNCGQNSFGDNCWSNRFGDNSHNNSLGDHSSNNTFATSCDSNIFVNNCKGNTFGNGVRYIKFNKDYMYNNIIENGNTFITVTSSQTTSESSLLRNFTIAQGVNNGSSEAGRLNISHDRINNDFRVTYQDSNSTTVNV